MNEAEKLHEARYKRRSPRAPVLVSASHDEVHYSRVQQPFSRSVLPYAQEARPT